MDNYDLSNLPLLSQASDSEDYDSWLSEEQNRWVTFSGRSVAVSNPEQAELQQPSLTYEEQLLAEQTAIADFDISLLSNTTDRATLDESKDPFTALAAYQAPTFDDDSQHPSDSEPGPGSGLLEVTAEDLADVVQAEPEGNDVFEQPEQSQGESDAQGIIIPESTMPDTVSDKRSAKRLAPEPSSLIKESVDLHAHDFLRRSGRLTEKRQKPDVTENKFSLLPLGMKNRAVTLVKRTAPQNKTGQNPDESLRKRVKKETEKWIVRCARNVLKRFKCGYPDCGQSFESLADLKMHIFSHTHISVYKCTYPECGDNLYFRNSSNLKFHVQSRHTHEKPYHCTLCDKHFALLYSYKRHMFSTHKMAV